METNTENNTVKEKEMDVQKLKIRNLLNTVYDIQKLRISTGNRIVQSFNIQMGQLPSTKQESMDEEVKSMLSMLRDEYRRITDAYVNKSYTVTVKNGKNVETRTYNVGINEGIDKIINKVANTLKTEVQKEAIIKSKLDYSLVKTYIGLLDNEENTIKILQKEVESHPLWDAFFKDVKGCGPLMAAVCISYFDINIARHVSSFWKYAGLDTVEVIKEVKDEEGRVNNILVREGRAMRHTEIKEYTDKNGDIKEKRSLTYNPTLKTKLCGVLGSSFIKAGIRTLKDENGNPVLDADGNKQKVATGYAKIYVDYKNRLNNRNDADKLTDYHKHAMANRYMIKQFIRDLWVTWRAMEGYEVTEPYEVAYLGYKPHKYNEYHENMAIKTRKVV